LFSAAAQWGQIKIIRLFRHLDADLERFPADPAMRHDASRKTKTQAEGFPPASFYDRCNAAQHRGS